MYKAIKEIGGFKPGDEVPEDKAKLWLEMYDVAHVELIDGANLNNNGSDEKEDNSDSTQKGDNVMFDDYLDRNKNVVLKNLREDNFEKATLNLMLNYEKENKNRTAIIKILKEKIQNLE